MFCWHCESAAYSEVMSVADCEYNEYYQYFDKEIVFYCELSVFIRPPDP